MHVKLYCFWLRLTEQKTPAMNRWDVTTTRWGRNANYTRKTLSKKGKAALGGIRTHNTLGERSTNWATRATQLVGVNIFKTTQHESCLCTYYYVTGRHYHLLGRDSRLSLFSEDGLRGSVYLHGWMYVSHSSRTYIQKSYFWAERKNSYKVGNSGKGCPFKQWLSSNATILEE